MAAGIVKHLLERNGIPLCIGPDLAFKESGDKTPLHDMVFLRGSECLGPKVFGEK